MRALLLLVLMFSVEATNDASKASNSSASATITITMYAVADE
jgi:hypothetical protein